MAGGRKPGPQGLYGDSSRRPDGLAGGWSQANPLGVGDAVAGADQTSAADLTTSLSADLRFSIGARHYRIVPAGIGLGADEERLDDKQAAEVLAEAAKAAPANSGFGPEGLLAELRRSGRPFMVAHVRPQAPAQMSSAAPSPAPSAAPPPRKPAPVKEGWIEIEVLDDAGEPREGDRYKLKLPDGRVLEGTIGGKGLISVHGIDPGSAELTITSLDGALWSA